jgi:hypothetical protein
MLDQRYPFAASLETLVSRTNEVLRKSYELLRASAPDVFLGRRSDGPLSPEQAEGSDVERWLASKELERPK